MSLIIKDPSASRLVLRRTWQPMDPDAAAYITAVEAADTAAGSPGGLEERTKIAIDNFVLGCKADGIWTAIKASCILAGARTLNGALQPLVGVAPTNFNFVEGDYNRKTGLAGDGSTKYLDSNRINNADPQNNAHASVYITTVVAPSGSSRAVLIGTSTNSAAGRNLEVLSGGLLAHKLFTSAFTITASATAPGFHGITRFSAGSYLLRTGSSISNVPQASFPPTSTSLTLYSRSLTHYTSSRLAFYSIGESLDLALLDARVTDLINAFATAIP